MNPRNLLHLRRQPPASLSREAPLEWLVTNGLGGYASGSVDGYVRRRFHGLLVASHPAPAGRVMLLHYLQETVTLDGHTRRALRPGPPDAGNVARLDFSLVAGLPQWSFALGPETTLEQSLVMPHDQNTVHVHYRLTGPSPVTLELRPWLDFRAHEGRLSATLDAHYDVTQSGPSGFEFEREGFPIPLRVTIGKDQVGRREAGGGRQSDGTPERDNGAQEPAPPFTFADEPGEWLNVPYDIESDRGYDAVGAMRSPGVFTLTLRPDEDVFFTASSEPWALIEALDPAATRQLELERREHLITVSDAALQSPDTFLLPLAADQFIVRPIARGDADAAVRAAGAEPRTVVAGYPWFTDWGRDTMISLEGLTLCTGRHVEARDILRTFARHVRHGLIPNLFPEGEREGLYHTADATLWFFHALHRYDTATGDTTLVEEMLPTLEEIVACHQAGTRFNIHVADDGLLAQGAEGYQLTWMDAKVGDWVVTPRRGKAVEINALWHNALLLLAGWMARHGRGLQTDGLVRDARRCHESFNRRFWDDRRGYLLDVVDGPSGDDDACRPNQVLAISLEHPVLAREHWVPVLDVVTRELLTPFGLRTLSPSHPDYKPRYFGDLRARDAAYHQGTVWPWLMGPYADAWLAAYPDDLDTLRDRLASLLDHVLSGGAVGSVSEIMDAQSPYTPRGCFAQAWSVAELARLTVKMDRG